MTVHFQHKSSLELTPWGCRGQCPLLSHKGPWFNFRWGEMAPWVRTLAAFQMTWVQFLTLTPGGLYPCNSGFQGSRTVFWPPQALHIHGALIYMQAKHLYAYNKNIFKVKKRMTVLTLLSETTMLYGLAPGLARLQNKPPWFRHPDSLLFIFYEGEGWLCSL